MAIYEGDYLKGRFEDGDKPTGQDFIDLVDSTLNSTVTSLSAGTDVTGAFQVDGNAHVGGNLNVIGTATISGGTVQLGDDDDDNVIFGADIKSSILPNSTDYYALGSPSKRWDKICVRSLSSYNAYAAGFAIVDGDLTVGGNETVTGNLTVTGDEDLTGSLTVGGAATLTSGTIDNIIIGGTTAVAGSFSTLNTTGDVTVNGNFSLGGTFSGDVALDGDLLPSVDVTTNLGTTSRRFVSNFLGGAVHAGIFSSTSILDGETTLTSASRNFCIEELNISDNGTLNISNGAELRITPYSKF